MFIDTHAHLFYPNYDGELDEIIERAKESSLDFIIVPATDIQTSQKSIELAEKYDMIYAAAGVHPHETSGWNKEMLSEIERISSHPKVIAIGEIGLDYYYDYSPKQKQIEAFRDQIDLALKLNKPIIVHNRDSSEDLLEIVGSYCGSGLKAQFHCFNGKLDEAIELISMNHYLSFTGNITYKKSENLRIILSRIPVDHLLLETDSPFMPPIPYRGKRNEPAFVKIVAEKISEITGMTLESIGRITSYNAFKLFGIGSYRNTVYTYKLRNSLYINVTNRCNADCVFCKRKTNPVLGEYNLKMSKNEEPDALIYIQEIGDPRQYDEIVFCGFGEPTIRWEVVKQVAKYVKNKGGKTRLNTNGHGNYINKRDITAEMKGLIDTVSISLNTFDPRQYAQLMKVETRLFNEMITFAKRAKNYVNSVVMTVVNIDQVEIEKARKIVEESIGAQFRVREYF
ncbi:MAG: YchF/TatD family DNA exonuclease [Ignavibacteriaceae bacterium]|nr:YchF/TatD family DNA exonuclease [Ignavibacteriaceae bacterium]